MIIQWNLNKHIVKVNLMLNYNNLKKIKLKKIIMYICQKINFNDDEFGETDLISVFGGIDYDFRKIYY